MVVLEDLPLPPLVQRAEALLQFWPRRLSLITALFELMGIAPVLVSVAAEQEEFSSLRQRCLLRMERQVRLRLTEDPAARRLLPAEIVVAEEEGSFTSWLRR